MRFGDGDNEEGGVWLDDCNSQRDIVLLHFNGGFICIRYQRLLAVCVGACTLLRVTCCHCRLLHFGWHSRTRTQRRRNSKLFVEWKRIIEMVLYWTHNFWRRFSYFGSACQRFCNRDINFLSAADTMAHAAYFDLSVFYLPRCVLWPNGSK